MLFVVAVIFVAAYISSEQVAAAVAATTTEDHIWSPGLSVTSISRYLLVFCKLFL